MYLRALRYNYNVTS